MGTLPATAEAQVQAITLPEIEALGEALLDFVEVVAGAIAGTGVASSCCRPLRSSSTRLNILNDK